VGGTTAGWRPERRTATCMACAEGVTVDGAEAGVAGGSARREGDRRREAQQARDGAGPHGIDGILVTRDDDRAPGSLDGASAIRSSTTRGPAGGRAGGPSESG
jgi:hypothetical protein